MSLASQAIVMLTHYALEGKTWAGDRIEEQPVDPIGDLLRGAGPAQRPVLAVYVESSKAEIDGRNTQGEQAEIDLKVFVYVSPGATETGQDFEFELDGTTAGLTLNLVGRQVDAAFHASDSEWLEIWKLFVFKIMSREVRYMLVDVENVVKIPAMEICYKCMSVPDPDFASPLYGAWQRFDSALRARSDEHVKLADLFKSMIEQPSGLPDYEVLRRNHGLTDAALAATGLGPYPGSADAGDEPVEIEDIIVEGDAITVPEDI